MSKSSDTSNNRDGETSLRPIAASRTTERVTETAASAAATQVASPEVVDGRYVLEQRLGGGGMGVVYRARDRLMEESQDPDPYVAIKLISDAIRQLPEAVLALQREARRSQTLAHPNIVKVFHFGKDGDTYYLTMELLRGRSFDELIREHPGGMALDAAWPLIEQLCAGLAHAHERRIVHSDIKPGNLFLADDGVVKILDFGIASPLRTHEHAARETVFNPRRLGALSPSYSSPEMWLGRDADPRDDVYSAACVIYELLAGVHPFQREEAPRALERGLRVPPIPSLNQAQNAALRRALSLKGEERTASVHQLLQELRQGAGRQAAPKIVKGVAAIAVSCAVAFVLFRMMTDSAVPSPRPTESASAAAAAIPIETKEPEYTVISPERDELLGAWRGAGACPDLDSDWDSKTCEQRRACFTQRAGDASAARSIAPPEFDAVYEARESLYASLAAVDCADMTSQRQRAYVEFRSRFPGHTVD